MRQKNHHFYNRDQQKARSVTPILRTRKKDQQAALEPKKPGYPPLP